MKHLNRYAAGAMLLAAPLLAGNAQAQGLPPADAKPGECYAKVLVPPTFSTSSESIQIHAGGINYTKTPAVYRTAEKRIQIVDPSYELVIVPATYETVEETVMIQPEQVVKTVVPATYRTESKRVMISSARSVWKVGRGAYEKVNSATGDIMCRVQIPAKYKDIMLQVVDKPAQTLEKVLPAKYVKISRRVMKTEPTTSRRDIPAKFKTIKVRELITPESFAAITTEPKFATFERRELQTPASIQWRQILCETNVTEQVVMKIQRALVSKGYSLGTQPNGNFGPATKSAIAKYQRDNDLPTGGLTIAAVRKLGVLN